MYNSSENFQEISIGCVGVSTDLVSVVLLNTSCNDESRVQMIAIFTYYGHEEYYTDMFSSVIETTG